MQSLNKTPSLGPGGRKVKTWIKIRALFGSTIVQVGLGIIAFLLVFLWSFSIDKTIIDAFRTRGGQSDWAVARGKIIDIGFSGIRINSRGLYKAYFKFEVGDQSYEATSYGYRNQFPSHEPNSSVDVRYFSSEPSLAIVEGTRRHPFPGKGGIFFLLFLIAPMSLVFYGLFHGLRAIKALKFGKTAKAKKTEKEPTQTRINNQRVYIYTFEFQDETGRSQEIKVRSHLDELMDREEAMTSLYLDYEPGKAVLLESLSGNLFIDEKGTLHGDGQNFLILVFPAICLIHLGIGILRNLS